MKKQWLAGVIALWVVSIGVAGLIGWNLRSSRGLPVEQETREEAVSTVPAPRAQDRLRREPPLTVAELKRENAELREELAELKDEMQKAASDYLMYAISQALERAAEREVSTQQVRSTWEAGLQAADRIHPGGMLDELTETIWLLVDMARLGDEGVRCLSDIAWDTERTTEERHDALEMLAVIPDKVSLETIMEIPDPESFGPHFPYDHIGRQLLKLPTADIQEYMPQITRYLSSAVAADQPERELTAILAFVHDDTFSSSLLHDPRIWQQDLLFVLWGADYVHTERAKEFLEEVRRTHSNEEFRTMAAEMLDNW
jgi:hypothetical protein